MNVLLIEHILFYSEAIRAAFFSRGHTCFLVENSAEALSYIGILSFDFVVVDSLTQGLTTLEDILHTCVVYDRPVILVSDSVEDRYNYGRFGVVGAVPRNKLLVYSFMDEFISAMSSGKLGGNEIGNSIEKIR